MTALPLIGAALLSGLLVEPEEEDVATFNSLQTHFSRQRYLDTSETRVFRKADPPGTWSFSSVQRCCHEHFAAVGTEAAALVLRLPTAAAGQASLLAGCLSPSQRCLPRSLFSLYTKPSAALRPCCWCPFSSRQASFSVILQLNAGVASGTPRERGTSKPQGLSNVSELPCWYTPLFCPVFLGVAKETSRSVLSHSVNTHLTLPIPLTSYYNFCFSLREPPPLQGIEISMCMFSRSSVNVQNTSGKVFHISLTKNKM